MFHSKQGTNGIQNDKKGVPPCLHRNTTEMEILIFTHQTSKVLKKLAKARCMPPVGSQRPRQIAVVCIVWRGVIR